MSPNFWAGKTYVSASTSPIKLWCVVKRDESVSLWTWNIFFVLAIFGFETLARMYFRSSGKNLKVYLLIFDSLASLLYTRGSDCIQLGIDCICLNFLRHNQWPLFLLYNFLWKRWLIRETLVGNEIATWKHDF